MKALVKASVLFISRYSSALAAAGTLRVYLLDNMSNKYMCIHRIMPGFCYDLSSLADS